MQDSHVYVLSDRDPGIPWDIFDVWTPNIRMSMNCSRKQWWLFEVWLKKAWKYMSVSRNGVYKIYDHMHVAFPRIIPRIMPPNHTCESYHESYPWFQQGRAKHTPKHTPETYLRNIPRIIPPDATRFAGHGVFGKGHISTYVRPTPCYLYTWAVCHIDIARVSQGQSFAGQWGNL